MAGSVGKAGGSLAWLVAVVGLAASTSLAQASTVTYTDRASFSAALDSSTTETFSASTPGNFPTQYSVPFTGFTLSGNTNGNRVGIATGTVANQGNDTAIPAQFDGQNFLGWGNGSTGETIGDITFTFSSPTTAVGFDWFNTDQTDTYGVRLMDGETFNQPPFSFAGSSAAQGFFGLVTTTAFTTLQIYNVDSGGYISTEGLDNLTFGNGTIMSTSVPEPSTLLLLGAFAGAAAVARRRT